jgi:hypothetical protein
LLFGKKKITKNLFGKKSLLFGKKKITKNFFGKKSLLFGKKKITKNLFGKKSLLFGTYDQWLRESSNCAMIVPTELPRPIRSI